MTTDTMTENNNPANVLPCEFTNRMRERLGKGFGSFISSYTLPYTKALRINTQKILPVDIARMSRIFTGSENPETVDWCTSGYYYEDHEPGKSVLHDLGAYYIQEASAMLPVTLLDINDSGQKVLDLCAAPGGKTTQIADLMNGRGLLVANEIIPSRASILSENIERMGVTNALVINEEPAALSARFGGYFDRILVDAPCSGEGMFRKHPEASQQWSLDNVKMCANRQDMILDRAADMLNDGGRIVYSTCTFSSEEEEGSIERFLSRHPDFAVEKMHRIYPHTHKGEGHFAAVLTKITSAETADCNYNSASKTKNAEPLRFSKIPRERIMLLNDFLKSTLSSGCKYRQQITDDPGRLLAFGDNIYLVPEIMPDISGLKVLRAGLKLGSFKKMRFEPDHALSHALRYEDALCAVNLDSDSEDAKKYITGLTLSCDASVKGWCLVCVEHLGLAWGKASGGVIKNHYPRGLRRNQVI